MPKDKVIISNPARLEAVKARIAADGPDNLQVLADFDRTLSAHFVGNEKAPTMIGVLRKEKLLTLNGYPDKAQALYDEYRPIEVDPTVPRQAKNEKMAEWFRRHYELLIDTGLTVDDLRKVALSPKLVMRDGVTELFSTLNEQAVPIVILSASGTGKDVIEWLLEREGLMSDNVHIISNHILWDETGKMKGVIEPIIHSLNKDYTYIKQLPNEQELSKRKNVILLGDNVEDISMAEGFDYANIIKIGFLNVKADGSKADFEVLPDGSVKADDASQTLINAYRSAYDAVILNDGTMRYINELLKEII